MKFCSKCGAEVHPEAVVCLKCGCALRPMGAEGTQRLVYILLAVFLGGIGIHNFYAGYTERGVAQLLIAVLTCGIGAIVTYIWAIVEICTVTVDAKGREMV